MNQPLDVYPKFKKLLRPLNQDEYQRLEWSILRDGIQDSIKYWPHNGKNYVLDGHNRYDIWSKYPDEVKGGYKAEPMSFDSEDEALSWIYENQLLRRNLNQNERVLYLGRLFETRKRLPIRPGAADVTGTTAELIAEEQDVSARTVTRSAEVVQAYDQADKDMQQKFAAGEITQAELLRTIRKKEDAKADKKDRLHNEKTAAIAAVGERIKRTITALHNQAEDLALVCKAIKVDPLELAPELANLTNKLKREMKQAEAITTIMYVGNLCPARPAECKKCKNVQYVTEVEFEGLKPHYGIEDKAKAA